MRLFNKGFNFGQDGPGNRLVYHLQGCNMRCIWCSNPEGMCLDGGRDVAVRDIVEECKRSRMMFFSGGGVTFTGGEATVQIDELFEVLKLLKTENIHTAIETNGTSPRLCDILDDIDYLIMDFKHYDSDALKSVTGVGNETTKLNYERNCSSGRQQHIRIPLINEINTQDPKEFAKYFLSFNTSNTVFEFLPYHEYGKEKWTSEYKVKNGFVSNKVLQAFKDAFEDHGLKIIIT